MSPSRPRLAVFKLASCDGCQVALFNLDETFLELAERFDIAFFLEATSRIEDGPYDISLVEGSVTTPADAERVRAIRAATRTLVAIGACATSGGIQALRNEADVEGWKRLSYPRPELVDVLPTSTPVSAHVAVDHEVHGCPVHPEQVLRVLTRALLGAQPDLPGASVCLECKRAEHACVLVTRGLACMGPVTRGGCGALCPALGRECYACFGPSDDPNPEPLVRHFQRVGVGRRGAVLRLRHVAGASPEFRRLADRLEGQDE